MVLFLDLGFFKHQGKASAWGCGAAVVAQVKEDVGSGIGAADKAEGANGVPADDEAVFGHGLGLVSGVDQCAKSIVSLLSK